MRELLFLGKSDGKVGSKHLQVCEHCGPLKKGVRNFDTGGVHYCEACCKAELLSNQEIAKAQKSKKKEFFANPPEMILSLDFNNHQYLYIYQNCILKNQKDHPSDFTVQYRKYQETDGKEKKLNTNNIPESSLKETVLRLIKKHSLQFNESRFRQHNRLNNPHRFKSKAIQSIYNDFHKSAFAQEKKEMKQIDRFRELSQGNGKIKDLSDLHSFLIFHFGLISSRWPSFITDELKNFEKVFTVKKDAVVLDSYKHELLWGSEENGSAYESDQADDDDGLPWEEAFNRITDLVDKEAIQKTLMPFFKKIGVSVKNDKYKLTFSVT